MRTRDRLLISLSGLALTLLAGTVGYHWLEGMTAFESLYMTVITIATVGFSELKPLSDAGRVLTMGLIALGVTIGGYMISMLMQIIVQGELVKALGRRKVERKIAELRDHIIICGFGRIGQIIGQELCRDNIGFIVIDEKPEAIAKAEMAGYLALQMDATTEEALVRAGILQARGLVTSVQSDADNVFITLTARGLRPDIYILSRASELKNEEKLRRAGASLVVSPYLIGGRRMAQVLKRPTVVDFIDIATTDSRLGLMIEEARVGPTSPLIGKNLVQSNLRRDYGVIIAAIKRASSEMIFNPTPSETLSSGDVIVVLGKREDLKRMADVL
jgi:voltage-gated potassium channel